jgi:flagellar basal body-associated protein FliL
MEEDLIRNKFDFELSIDDAASEHLKQIGQWAKIKSISLWIILCSIIILFIVMGSKISDVLSAISTTPQFEKYGNILRSFGASILITIMIIFLFLAAAFVFLLFNFGNKLRRGLRNTDMLSIEAGLKNYNAYVTIGAVLSTFVLIFTLTGLFFK